MGYEFFCYFLLRKMLHMTYMVVIVRHGTGRNRQQK